jgi:hypothetical protein
VATELRNSANRSGTGPDPKDVLKFQGSRDKSQERVTAELGLSPIAGNAVTARTFIRGTFGITDLTESVAVLTAAVAKVNAGDLSEAEALLTAQAVALNAIFTELARRASLNMGEYLNAAEVYMRLSLKAQAQCRATLETLAEIKNPRPVAFVKQANIAQGPQQVNNAAAPPLTRARENESGQNELLEVHHGKGLDIGATGAAIDADPAMATVGKLHRAEVP